MRESGILLPIFSLPSDYGIGSLGKSAVNFIDFLKDSLQSYWQILPIGPTALFDSPYQSPGAFAGNPYFIDLEELFKMELITREELESQKLPWGKIDYGFMYNERLPLLEKAAERLTVPKDKLCLFKKENSFWLEDYCIFMAYKKENGMNSLAFSKENAPPVSDSIMEKAEIQMKLQYLFFTQWEHLHSYAEKSGIKLIGDLPIYVARDSSDFFAHRELFPTDKDGNPSLLAGCPPDSFCEEGQLWGNPVYDWQNKYQECLYWWKERIKQAKRLFDSVRIDHFRAVHEYYTVPNTRKNAVEGKWLKGPGKAFCEMLSDIFPTDAVIAEDLGFMTESTRKFFRQSGFSGMKILQFAFGEENSEHLPHNHEKNFVCYTGTHDNPTLLSWICTAEKDELSRALDYLGGRISSLRERMISAAMGSTARLTVIPLQDYIGEGCKGRINTPGKAADNWQYRLKKEELNKRLENEIIFYTKTYARNPQEDKK